VGHPGHLPPAPGRPPQRRRLSLSRHGRLFPTTGWVYDESGKERHGALGRGQLPACAARRATEAKAYPTRTLKGLVFVVDRRMAPPRQSRKTSRREFFDEDALVLIGQVEWRCNWGGCPRKTRWTRTSTTSIANAVVVARSGFIARGAQGRASHLRGQRLRRRRRPRATTCARTRGRTSIPTARKVAKGRPYRRFWTWLNPAPSPSGQRRHIPPPRSPKWWRWPSPARHVSAAEFGMGPLHPHVRAPSRSTGPGSGTTTARGRKRPRSDACGEARRLCPPCTGGSSSTISRVRTSAS